MTAITSNLRPAARAGYYPGMFLIACTTLVLEIALMRLMSVVTWYHLAFFAISVGMLGMTAGAVSVYLRPRKFDAQNINASLASACMAFAISLPFMLYIVCLFPIDIADSGAILYTSATATIACVVPFYFSGVVVTAVLTRSGMQVNRLYAADLVGASTGCLLVLAFLEFLDVPSLIILCGAIACLAGMCFAGREPKMITPAGFGGREIPIRLDVVAAMGVILFIAFSAWNATTKYGLQPVFVKRNFEDPDTIMLRKWNSFSRVMVRFPKEIEPSYWGPSELAPKDKIKQASMNIDGEAGTTVRVFESRKDIEHLAFDVTTVAYQLGRKGDACIIGVGGGRDVQTALLFDHPRVIGIEINPVFINLLKNEFRDFAGIAGHKGVELVADEARSYLSRTPLKCSILQMSLIDTWAATGAGAFSLSENSLYTVEGWKIFLGRLADDGVFTVSRWYNRDNLGETGRLVSLASATLLESGIQDPEKHLAMVTSKRVSTLILSKTPLSAADIDNLQRTADEKRFEVVFAPGQAPRHPVLKEILAAKSSAQLEEVARESKFNFSPPRDDSPYFFNLLKTSSLFASTDYLRGNQKVRWVDAEGVLRGNMVATSVLLALIGSLAVFAALTIIVPLAIARRRGLSSSGSVIWQGAVFFAMIGAGFMFAEIGLVQRLSVFLGHPVYALGVLLFSLIAATGIGSFLSGRLPVSQGKALHMFPLALIGLILLSPIATSIMMESMVTASIPMKAAASLILTVPMGILMGFFYPTGMKIVERLGKTETPWYWALNGIMGTLVSGLAVFVSIYFSITHNFILGALAYAIAAGCLWTLASKTQSSAASAWRHSLEVASPPAS